MLVGFGELITYSTLSLVSPRSSRRTRRKCKKYFILLRVLRDLRGEYSFFNQAMELNRPVLSPKRSVGAPIRSSSERNRLLSGVCGGAWMCRPVVIVPPPEPAS